MSTGITVSVEQLTVEASSTEHRVTVSTSSVETIGIDAARGPQGPKGDPAQTYDHAQSSASDTWVINHNLGVRPFVALFNTGGVSIEGEVVHASSNQTIVYFATAVAGSARCL